MHIEKLLHLYIVVYVIRGVPLTAFLALKNSISELSPTSSGLILSRRRRRSWTSGRRGTVPAPLKAVRQATNSLWMAVEAACTRRLVLLLIIFSSPSSASSPFLLLLQLLFTKCPPTLSLIFSSTFIPETSKIQSNPSPDIQDLISAADYDATRIGVQKAKKW